jgi:Tfp pilus assembly protein PilF
MHKLIFLFATYTTCIATNTPIDLWIEQARNLPLTTKRTLLQKVLTFHPQQREALHQLALSYAEENKFESAEYYYKRALSLDPENIQLHKEFAHLLQKQERCNEALHHYRFILEKHPHDMYVNFDAAFVCTMIGLVDEAVTYYGAILKQYPNNTQALHNTGYSLKMAGRIDEALTYYHRVLALKPDSFQAHYAATLSYLAQGDFETGWKWYETYLKREHINGDKLRHFLATNTLAGKRLLLRHQGGLGDTLQFIRFAKLLHDQGAYVMVIVPDSLHPLLRECSYIDEVLGIGKPMPAYDDTATIMGLGAIMHATESMMSSLVPYLTADQTFVEQWKNTLAHDHNFKIGLCWQSDVKNDQSRLPVARRGIPLELLALLADIPGVSFYSLQQCDGLEQLKKVPHSFKIHTFDDDFDKSHGRFMDTAAVMKNLDLVITVDTAIAHLAGGLGVPVWLMLPYSTDWRWIAGRQDTPWYPNMRIFKQDKPFDWTQVTKDIKHELEKIRT